MKTTTIKIYTDDLPWWKECCKRYDKNSPGTFRKLKTSVLERKQQEFYKTLSHPSDFKKPLSEKRIDKSIVTKKIYKND